MFQYLAIDCNLHLMEWRQHYKKLSKNHSFIVEVCFDHTLIYIIKSEYLEEKDMKTIS